jgi:hypothetical protein
MRRTLTATLAAAILAATFFFGGATSALAHGHTNVGDYELVIGFRNEPAYVGEPNGLDLRVTNTKTGEPVTGLEETLKATLVFGGSSRELAIEPRWGQEGAYTAQVIPTETGDYTWKIVGDIEGTPVDVEMSAGPETFSSIESKSAVAFPAAEPTAAELQAQVAAAQRQAQTALTIGIVGVALGLVGAALGFLGLRGRSQLALVAQAGERSSAR